MGWLLPRDTQRISETAGSEQYHRMAQHSVKLVFALQIILAMVGCTPRPSNSGQISFTVNAQNMESFLLNLQTKQLLNLTNSNFDDWWPTWSPDGRYMAYTSSRTGNYDLYILDTRRKEV